MGMYCYKCGRVHSSAEERRQSDLSSESHATQRRSAVVDILFETQSATPDKTSHLSRRRGAPDYSAQLIMHGYYGMAVGL